VKVVTEIHIMLFSSYEFHANRYSENHTLLKGVNEVLPAFYIFLFGLGQNLVQISMHCRYKMRVSCKSVHGEPHVV